MVFPVIMQNYFDLLIFFLMSKLVILNSCYQQLVETSEYKISHNIEWNLDYVELEFKILNFELLISSSGAEYYIY